MLQRSVLACVFAVIAGSSNSRPHVSVSDEWQGSYYVGDGLGVNITLELGASYLRYAWHGCLNLYDSNEGEVVEVFDDGVRVALEKDEHQGHYHFISSRLYFVRWGERRYLVPEAQMMRFLDDYNAGGSRRRELSIAPLKRDPRYQVHDERPPERGLPQLPKAYAADIIERPLKLGVTLDGAPKQKLPLVQPVRLAAGRKQGLYRGLAIRLETAPNGELLVTDVDEDEARGEIRGATDETPPEHFDVSLPGADSPQ